MIPWILATKIPLPIALVACFLSDVTAHPIGAAGLAGLLAYLLAERWQRWRQRRDFQHRAIVEFSEASIALINNLHALIDPHTPDQHMTLGLDYRARFERLVARDAQLYAFFSEKTVVNEMYTMALLMNVVFKNSVSGDRETNRRAMRSVSALRRLILGRMAAEMRLRSRDAFNRLRRELKPTLKPPPEYVEQIVADLSRPPTSPPVDTPTN